jgi:hypothetical protein
MTDTVGPSETSAAEASAAEMLRRAQLRFGGEVVGTVAACDPGPVLLNYRECFLRDFATSAAALLAAGRVSSVRAFIVTVARLQAHEGADAGMRAAPGLMPASFAVVSDAGASEGEGAGERIVADFGQRAIGRVAPIDAALWWLLILRAACELLDADDPLRDRAFERLVALGLHLRRNDWLDRGRIEEIRRYPVEEYGDAQRNPRNLHPDAVPTWTMAWLSEGGGDYAGNLGPA